MLRSPGDQLDRGGADFRRQALERGNRNNVVNLARRNLSKGQQAMVAAKCFAAKQSWGSDARLVRAAGISKARLSCARAVIEWAPELVEDVIDGAVPLDAAYKEAQDRKATAGSESARLERLRGSAPDLADLVREERMTLTEAQGAAEARRLDEGRQTRVATQYLADSIKPLANTAMTADVADAAQNFARLAPAAVIEDSPDA